MSEIDVCRSGWHGVHSTTVTLKNSAHNSVTVSPDSSCTWPFPKEKKPFTIPKGGTKDVVLADDPTKSYCYSTDACPDDHSKVNPKTVIIS